MRTSSSVILALALLAGGVTSFNAPVRTVRLATSPSWLARPQTLPRLHAEGDDAEAPAEPDFEAAAASTATGEKTPIDAIEVSRAVLNGCNKRVVVFRVYSSPLVSSSFFR
jgi:hypothetical protein